MHQSDRKRFIDPKRGGLEIHAYATRQDIVLRVAAWCESFACAIERTGTVDGDRIQFAERHTTEESALCQEWRTVCGGLGMISFYVYDEPDNPEAVSLSACANSMLLLIVGTPERAFPLAIPADTPERFRAGARELRARAECFDDPEPAMAENKPKAVEDAPVDDAPDETEIPSRVYSKAERRAILALESLGAGRLWSQKQVEDHSRGQDDPSDPVDTLRISTRKLSDLLPTLIDEGIVERPDGRNGGVRITLAGIRVAQEIA
jgi:hypothetical protein